ncbi:TRAF-like protein [Saccoglossus kowalevskii]|uniref:TRAF-like protein n=1 Tax=Saccoglossus kowalevskii TaxID=10224 RepID=D1LXG5_SACKO|nr:TRAF-like protein [Saccoglossus kowalevskii]ACY92671.1 TRAF-like protein [Saccoglossus kowalevskii]
MPGYQYKFAEKVRRKYVCPLCRLPMRDPVQITTCEHRFCDICLQAYLSEGIFQCPEDKIPLDYAKIYPDDDMTDEIVALTIRCSYYKDGCKWIDQLENLKSHLESCKYNQVECPNNCTAVITRKLLKHHLSNECPRRTVVCEHCGADFTGVMMEGHRGSCQFQQVQCENKCGVKLQRRYLSSHTLNECPKRMLSCKYCHKDVIFDTLQTHLHHCLKYPVTCPNRCDPERLARGDLEKHLKENCPSSTINCPFQGQGCKYKSPRFALEQHLENNSREHLLMMCMVAKRQEEEILSLRAELDTMTGNTDGTLLWKIDNYSSLFAKAKKETTELCSKPFFTSKYGYKLGLTAFLNGNGSGEGTHFSLYIKILPGEYDTLLQWPFTHPVEFTLLDQTDDAKKRRHIKESFTADASWKNFHRPSKQNITLGYGYPTLISHEELNLRNYIRDDTIFIKVKVDTSKIVGI